MHVTQASPINDVARDDQDIILSSTYRQAAQLLGKRGLLSTSNSGLSQ